MTKTRQRLSRATAGVCALLIFLSAIPARPVLAEAINLESSGGGTYVVPAQINGAVTIKFVVDSGAAEVTIPQDVALTLMRGGTLTSKDFIGTRTYVLADGSKMPSDLFVIHSLTVGNHTVHNVVASVAPVEAEPLLGQSFLKKLPQWAFDNSRHLLVIGDEPSSSTVSHQQTPAPTVSQRALPPRPISAADAIIQATRDGNVRAEYALALAYQNGLGVKTDTSRAVSLMRDAAQRQLAVAQRTLGVWYEQGDGVPKDLAKAREWYEKAASGGDVQAMHNLGFFYAQGMGGLQRDGAAAQKWFTDAAERGLVASQINLAISYTQGASYGMAVQNDQAYLWSAIAARSGDQEAIKMRDAIAQAIPVSVKAQMDSQASAYKPKPIDLIANGGFDSSPEAFLPENKRAPLSLAEMTSVQEMLNGLGFSVGTADGHGGPQTTAAAKAFQTAYGLEVTGKADLDLLAALNAIPH